jgi:hypothetical protein
MAAEAISAEYRGADAMSAAKVSDVDTQLTTPPPAAAATTPTTITPQEAQQQTQQPVTPTTTGSPDGGKEYTG